MFCLSLLMSFISVHVSRKPSCFIPASPLELSEIGYLLLPSRDMPEIPLRRRKSLIQPTNQPTNQPTSALLWSRTACLPSIVRPSYINITFYTFDFCLEIAESILTKRTQWVLKRYIVLYHFFVFGPIGESGQPCLWLAEPFSVFADCSSRSDNEYRCRSVSLVNSIILFITWWTI